jgi:hypothetical protein
MATNANRIPLMLCCRLHRRCLLDRSRPVDAPSQPNAADTFAWKGVAAPVNRMTNAGTGWAMRFALPPLTMVAQFLLAKVAGVGDKGPRFQRGQFASAGFGYGLGVLAALSVATFVLP